MFRNCLKFYSISLPILFVGWADSPPATLLFWRHHMANIDNIGVVEFMIISRIITIMTVSNCIIVYPRQALI